MNDDTKIQPAFPEARAKKLTQRKMIWLIGIGGLLLAAVAGGFAGYFSDSLNTSIGGSLAPLPLFLLLVAASILSMWWSLHYWRSIDEMARRAHLDSWFWGGVPGSIPLGILGMVALVEPSFKVDAFESLAMSPTQVFGLGAVAIYGCMLVGYTIFWLIWWVRKR
jgi:hypothetical protein